MVASSVSLNAPHPSPCWNVRIVMLEGLTTREYSEVRERFPSEAVTWIAYVPGGVCADVAKVNPEVHTGVHEGDAKVHVVCSGRFEQENPTTWVNPEVELAVTFVATAPPVRTEPDWGLTPTEKSKRDGDAGTERATLNAVVREVVPSEPATVTRG